MDRAEKCFLCGNQTPEADLVAWFVQDERRLTHTECWLAAHRSQPSARKTLDDIRRELEAEYPSPGEPATPPVHVPMPPYLNGDEGAAIRRRSASRRRGRRGHAVAVAVGCIAAPVLLFAVYVWVTRDVIWPDNAPAAAEAGPDRGSPMTSSASFAVEPRGVEPRDEPAVAVAPPALPPGVEEQLTALRTELHAIAAKLERSESRMIGVEARVKGVESSMQRLGDEVASAAATRPLERAPAPPRLAGKPAPSAPPPPAATAVTADYSERWIPSEPARPNALRRGEMRPLAEEVAPRSMSPRPRAEPARSLESRAPATEAAPSRTATAAPDDAAPISLPPTLGDKLRDDWRTIKQGFAIAGAELKASVRDLARRVRKD
jgi:hypothetical protein